MCYERVDIRILKSRYNFCRFQKAARVGGISDDEKTPSDELKEIVKSLNAEIKSEALASFTGSDGEASSLKEHFRSASVVPLSHKTQVVAGVNYFVRTKIGDYIFHVRIYRDLQRNASVTRVIGPKKESDPIGYF